jgi:hypothetical protein
VDPSTLPAWFNKANAELALDDARAARASFQRFLQLGPPPALGAQIAHARQALAKLGG